MRYKVATLIELALLLFASAACSDAADTPASFGPAPEAMTPATSHDWLIDDKVLLRESSVSWETYQYELTEANGIVDGSYDGVTKVQHAYKSWILENEYLQVTLVPEMGGRILSIIYKPTGHEELYQNPLGVPYQIGTDIFYYDWLMVYGGIFPTFPEPEHGKTWLLPWDFEVMRESDQEIVVAMSIKDEIDNPNAPRQYNLGPTGIELTYTVSLKAGRAAIDTTAVLLNPNEKSVVYEYWTNTTLAPGSDPLDPKATAGAEIIVPVDKIKIPNYWQGIAAQENGAGLGEVYEFSQLRRFENWPDMGIAYAFPDMNGQNFWGVINHDNNEGIFRIADNTLTPGLKIWTWGYPRSTSVDLRNTADEARPYIELWAGVTREFWQRAELPANGRLEIEEIYSPSVGLANVTHANSDFLVNLASTEPSAIRCQLFGLYPRQTVVLSMNIDGVGFYENTIDIDPTHGNDCFTEIPDAIHGDELELLIKSENGTLLFEGAVPLSLDQ